MSSLVSRWGRDSRPRRASTRRDFEALESRALLSTTGTNLFGAPTTPPTPKGLPTTIVMASVATTAEAGQSLPLIAAVMPGGTAQQLKASIGQVITGTIEFYTDSPRRIVLGSIPINQGSSASSNSFLSAIQSTFGAANRAGSGSIVNTAFLWTTKLKDIGPYQIQARFIPSNNIYAASTSAIKDLTITPKTKGAPTTTRLEAPTSGIETGAAVAFSVDVHNPDSSLAGGYVQLVTVSPHPVVLGRISVGQFDRPIGFSTRKLRVGTYQVEAVYTPSTNRFASSTSPPVTITVTPLTAVSFRVTPVVKYGWLNQPLSFDVTALDARGKRLPSYTGTVYFTSPTDSWTILPQYVYQQLKIAPPANNAPWLATFAPGAYTFTPADQGIHRFVDAIQFGKGGMNTLQVTQSNDPEVTGTTVLAIAPRVKPTKGHTGYSPYGLIDLRKKSG